LQVINCCISRKHGRAIVTESLEADLKHAKDSSGEHVLRLGADKQLENTTLLDTNEHVYTPVLQV